MARSSPALQALRLALLLGLAGCSPAPAPSDAAGATPTAAAGAIVAEDAAQAQRLRFDALIGGAPHSPILPDDALLTRIGFGSCLHQRRSQQILDAVSAQRWDLFLFLGDNVYGDVDDADTDDLSPLLDAYALQAESAGLNALRAAVPTMAVWDDHDYGLNDGGADFALRDDSQRAFEAFWHVPADSQRALTPGVYSARTLGPAGQRVQIILLDTRYFRSPLRVTDQRGAPGRERYLPDPTPDKTMLGEAQWAWLEARLREPAELRLLVSSIQLIADGHGWESWRELPLERERLYALLRETDARGTLVLSGDRHRAGLYRHRVGDGAPLLEITSSSLNVPIPGIEPEAGPNRIGATYDAENFGSVVIDWRQRSVTLQLHGMDGAVVDAVSTDF